MCRWSFSERDSMLYIVCSNWAHSSLTNLTCSSDFEITHDLTIYVWSLRHCKLYHNRNGSLEICPQDSWDRVKSLYRCAALICGYPLVVDDSSLICWSEAIADQPSLVLDEHNGNITEWTQTEIQSMALYPNYISLLYMIRCRRSLKVWSLTKQTNLSLHLALERPTISSLYWFSPSQAKTVPDSCLLPSYHSPTSSELALHLLSPYSQDLLEYLKNWLFIRKSHNMSSWLKLHLHVIMLKTKRSQTKTPSCFIINLKLKLIDNLQISSIFLHFSFRLAFECSQNTSWYTPP